MLHYDFQDSVGYWLCMAQQAYFRAVTEAIEPYGITYRQAQVLGNLAHDGPLSQCELASKMMIEPATLVGVLDRMQRDGWIERRPCPDDRRRNQIHPLPAAEQVWAKIVECSLAVRQRAVAGMSPDDVQTIKSLLDQLCDNLGHQHPHLASKTVTAGESSC